MYSSVYYFSLIGDKSLFMSYNVDGIVKFYADEDIVILHNTTAYQQDPDPSRDHKSRTTDLDRLVFSHMIWCIIEYVTYLTVFILYTTVPVILHYCLPMAMSSHTHPISPALWYQIARSIDYTKLKYFK